MVKRIYVAKKSHLANAEKQLLREWRDELGIKGLRELRIWHRYDVEGADDELLNRAADTVFAEPPVDKWTNKIGMDDADLVFATELLPGQFDQRADSAEQCMRLLDPRAEVRVAYATVYIVYGDLSFAEIKKLKEYVINPIEMREAAKEIPATLKVEYPRPADVDVVDGVCIATRTELEQIRQRYGLAMNLADLECVQMYFRNEARRDPTITEMRVLDTYWSDHCRHTTFNTTLNQVRIEDGKFTEPLKEAYDWYLDTRERIYTDPQKRPETLMDMATLAVRALKKQGLLKELDESEEVNACTIRIPVETAMGVEQWLLLFKNETHNHPTEIEPFGGASTCLGGCIRDPLSGRAYVYQAMRVTGSGDPRQPIAETLPGKLPQRVITTKAAAGYSSYGNQVGLAAGEIKEYYHPGFIAKRMEVGAVVGAVPANQVVREVPEPGDRVILVGGKTGRDGCGGATGSSKEHSLESLYTCGSEVQKGNPPTERKLQCLFRRPEASRLIRRCNDFGAGGVAVAVGELADGVRVNLDAVPKKYTGLDGTELAISESQERMAVVVAADDADAFIRFAHEENLEATIIAEVTRDPRLVMTWRGDTIVDIARDFLDTNGATRRATAIIEAPTEENFFVAPDVDEHNVSMQWREVMRDLNIASQEGLIEMFDGTIGANTVLTPLGGKNMETPVDGMVAKIPLACGETDTVSIMTHSYDPYLMSWSPFHGGFYAVLNSLAKITALGGNWRKSYLTLQEYFEKLGTAESWGKPVAAVIGAFAAQMELGIGAIGGKDSMSGTFMDLSVPPTLISFAVAPGDAREIISPEWKARGHALVLLETPIDEYCMPDMETFAKLADRIYKAAENKDIYSLSVIGKGGIAATAAKAAFGNDVGARISTSISPQELFTEKPGSWIAEVDVKLAEEWANSDANIRIIGLTEGNSLLYGLQEMQLDDLRAAWREPLAGIFPLRAEPDKEAKIPHFGLWRGRSAKRIAQPIARPKVLLPIMPGTNCETDTVRSFARAGADCEIVKIRDSSPQALEESVTRIANALKTSQILAFPGGFSAGDEPDGSGKFISVLFRHPLLVESIDEFIANKDGLILGICNGFQALIKLGLLPYGEIRQLSPESPTLTFNTVGRHISRYVTTRVVSVVSPWLMYCDPGELHNIPISHGEGRFVASDEVIRQLAENGQIATQYTDPGGHPTMDSRYNPNGSLAAIEGITAANGRIFGKMGHSERFGTYVAKNIPGPKEQPIFQAGVDYFAK